MLFSGELGQWCASIVLAMMKLILDDLLNRKELCHGRVLWCQKTKMRWSAGYDGNCDTFQSFDKSVLFVWLTRSWAQMNYLNFYSTFEPIRTGSLLLAMIRTEDRTLCLVQPWAWTLDQTWVPFGEVQVQTLVQNWTVAPLVTLYCCQLSLHLLNNPCLYFFTSPSRIRPDKIHLSWTATPGIHFPMNSRIWQQVF
jgi:hypothetical protein